MFRNLFFILVCVFLSSCVKQEITVVYKDYKEQKSKEFDSRVMRVFTYSHFNEFKEARDEFLALFEDYKILSFLENAYLLSLANNLDKTDALNELAKPYLKESDTLKRLSVLYDLQNLNLTRAEKLIKELLKSKGENPRDFELYGDVLFAKGDFKDALKYYKMALKHYQSEELLFKIIGIYANANDIKNVKILLENFKKNHSCTLKTCLLLAKIYREERNFKALEQIYLSLYDLTNSKDFILALIELLTSQNKKQEALNYALKYEVKDEIKIFLYQSLKQFKEAKELSLELYKQSKNKEFLLRAAVFEFEEANSKGQIPPEKIAQIIDKFEEGIEENSDALYLNYYGYLLIDYDLDLKKGIRLVKLALEQDPSNFYYLDSLAWGYYKLGACKEAYELLEQTFSDKEFTETEESKAHIKAIKRCLTNDTR